MVSNNHNEDEYPIPSAENLRRIGSHTAASYLERGQLVANILGEEIETDMGTVDSSKNILDFGCGVGRVTLPLLQKFPDANYFCTDVDHTAINFMVENHYPRCIPLINNYEPPLAFATGFFDIVFSISVWSHLPPALQIPWLVEIHRVTSKNALVLITTAGYKTREYHLKNGRNVKITAKQIRDEGIIFIENKRARNDPDFCPGVTGEYGIVYQDPEYVADTWGKVFNVREVRPAGIGSQDLVVLHK